jgi:hypothetical protein
MCHLWIIESFFWTGVFSEYFSFSKETGCGSHLMYPVSFQHYTIIVGLNLPPSRRPTVYQYSMWEKGNEMPQYLHGDIRQWDAFFHSSCTCSTYSRSWARLEESPIVQPPKNLPAFYWNCRFITVITRARSIQFIPSHLLSLRSILILPTNLVLGLPSGPFPSDFPTKILYAFLLCHIRATCPTHLILLGHVKWAPCQHGMARPQVADGGDALQLWRVAANILNKQSRTAERGWSCSLVVGRGANNSSP